MCRLAGGQSTGDDAAEILIIAIRSRGIVSVAEVNVYSAYLITAVNSCFVANREIIHCASKSDCASVF